MINAGLMTLPEGVQQRAAGDHCRGDLLRETRPQCKCTNPLGAIRAGIDQRVVGDNVRFQETVLPWKKNA